MNLTQMKQLVAHHGIHLTKSLGQNFLYDGNQLRRIVRAAGLKKTDQVLEVGPGLGPLTELLLEQAGHVLAIEKDGRLVQLLRERFSPSAVTLLKSHLELIEADALKYLRREAANWRGWSVVSNLPYSVASPILVELAQASPGPDRMVVTLQLEVARRLMAKAGEADYGILTLLVQVAYEPIEWFKIPATCFFPEPDVDSACVVLNRRSDAFCNNTERKVFNGIVKRSFSQRRKMMAKLLKVDWPVDRLNAAFTQAGLLNNVRAETVTLEQFVKLTRTLYERRDF